MRLRSAKSPPGWSWGILSAEIRSMILHAITSQKNTGWASNAAVCREWQQVLEACNLRKLKLGIGCLDDFGRIMSSSPQKRRLVQHICLNIELPRYLSKCCPPGNQWAKAEVERYGPIVDSTIMKLFIILAEWKKPLNASNGGLTLELNVYSPSDSEHWFQNIFLSSDNVEDTSVAATEPLSDVWHKSNGHPYHDPTHGWDNGRQFKFAPKPLVKWLFRPVTMSHNDFPPITAVTCLIIRRQLRRCIAPDGVTSIIRNLKGLDTVWYEPWEPYSYKESLEAIIKNGRLYNPSVDDLYAKETYNYSKYHR